MHVNIELPEDFFDSIFRTASAELAVVVEHRLVEAVGDKVVVGVNSLDHEEYEHLGLCERELQHSPRPILTRYWGGEDHDTLFDAHEQSLWKVAWKDATLYVLDAQWSTACGGESRSWVIAARREIADEFILDVARKTNDPGKSMLVFRRGHWDRSRELFRAVQKSSFEDLVLPSELLSSLRKDFQQFLVGREHYQKYGLPWRRGALFIGPPGNGKTHCVRALVKELGVPSLYVQSLQHPHFPSEFLLKSVFDRARKLRPCVLILEDLEALIDTDNQSFFLNQLDGFEQNVGLIVLATTNHPERIDPAITHRPSRFDRKYHFGLPESHGRLSFLLHWQKRLSDHVQWSDEAVQETAAGTNGFSFAYLKELMISALMASMSDEDMPFTLHVSDQLSLLRKQMTTDT